MSLLTDTVCRIKGCKHEPMLNRYFCPTHDEWWNQSPERRRAQEVDTAAHTVSMLSDFVTRINSEGKSS